MDSLFAQFPGVKGSPVTTSKNGLVTLVHLDPTIAEGEMAHDRATGITDIDSGNMDGFPSNSGCNTGPTSVCPYVFLTSTDIPFLYQLASTYTICDNCFPSMLGPSFPNHLLAIAGGFNDITTNPNNATGADPSIWDCFSRISSGGHCAGTGCEYNTVSDTGSLLPGNIVQSTGATYTPGTCGGTCTGGTFCRSTTDCASCTVTSGTVPANTACTSTGTSCPTLTGIATAACEPQRVQGQTTGSLCPSGAQITTLFDELTTASVSHRWYGPAQGTAGELWVAPFYTVTGAFGAENANVFTLNQWFTDIASNTLPTVSFLTPDIRHSMHPVNNGDTLQTVRNSEEWLKSILQPLFLSPIYSSTEVIIWWDDWGGHNDHIAPPNDAAYPSMGALGIRTPLLGVGPFSRHIVFSPASAVQIQDSILRCFQDTFSLPTLGHREDVAPSICAGMSSGSPTGIVDTTQVPIATPEVRPSPTVQQFARRRDREGPDVITLAMLLKKHLHHERHDDQRIPELASRPCVLPETKKGFLPYAHTGQMLEVCISRDGAIVLPPGDNGEDHDEPDEPKRPRKKHKWLRRAAVIGSSALVAKLADDLVDGAIGPKRARYVGAAALIFSLWLQHVR